MRRPIRSVALLALLLLAAPSWAATARELYTAAVARQQALHQEGRSAGTLKQYRAAIGAFETVVRRYPTSGYADNALWEASQLAAEAHARFGDDREAAARTRLLTWLVGEYPTSKLAPRARDELHRGAAAVPAAKPTEAPAKKAAEPKLAREGTAKPPAGESAAKPTAARTALPDASVRTTTAASSPTVLRDVRRTVMGDIVRVTIQLDDEVVYRSERVENPPRVLFDLASTRLGPAVGEGTLSYSGDLVRHVRVGRHPNQVVRVVVDLEGVRRYSVFALYSPYRIVIDCERDRPAVPAGVAPASSPAPAAAAPAPAAVRIDEERLQLPPPEPEPEPDPLATRPIRSASSLAQPTVVPPPAPRTPAAARAATEVVATPRVRPLRPVRTFAPTRRLPAWQPVIHPPFVIVFPAPTPDDDAVAVAPVAPPLRTSADRPRTTLGKPADAPSLPPSTPANGFSLARQLGLGASRIVIDPGHGGHDPGAEGPGIFESEVVLDVALRLEKLLQAAGMEVVLTRRTDEYVPLEERTAIANRSRGDLFLSIHANASRKRTARGVESYFLNFATNPDAEAVAARENAATGRTMSNLTDIVKAITLNNKLDESKSLAALVQNQLVEHLRGSNKGLMNHGVKHAPFVVLIGASMPSVLVEVSFITNSQEGRLLKTGPYRQKIAEALFDGLKGYQKSLKGAAALTSQD